MAVVGQVWSAWLCPTRTCVKQTSPTSTLWLVVTLPVRLFACWHEAYGDAVPAAVLDGLTADLEGRRASWRRALSSGSITCVATVGAAVVGFASVGPARDQDLAHLVGLSALYVLARQYGTGLADRLVDRLSARLRRTCGCWRRTHELWRITARSASTSMVTSRPTTVSAGRPLCAWCVPARQK